MLEITKGVVPEGEPLGCGHLATKTGIALGTGVAFTPDGKSMCYSCADIRHQAQIEALDVGEKHSGYLRMAHPFGPSMFARPENGPNRVGEVTTWTGGHLAWIIPGSISIQRSTGFGTPYQRIHARAITAGGKLLYVFGNGDGWYCTVKRMRDRPNPLDKEAPDPRTKRNQAT